MKVSNPWREAIEDVNFCNKMKMNKFPILGGRLLKAFIALLNRLDGMFPILGGRLLKP